MSGSCAARALVVGVALGFILSPLPPPALGAPGALFVPEGVRDFGLDSDGDGLYEHLVLNVPVEASKPDFYIVVGMVSVAEGAEPLSRATQRQYIDVGRGSVSLGFPGQELSRMEGERHLSFDLALQGPSGETLDTSSHTSARVYSGAMFEGAAVEPALTGEVVETAEDLDGDGLYEYLNISAGIENITDLELKVSGALNGRLVGWGMVRVVDKRTGMGVVELRFDGGGLARLGVDGPYNVSIRVALATGGELFATHITRPYSSKSFEEAPPPIELTGRGRDGGIDRDGDGLFDALEVTLKAEVMVGGAYLVKGVVDRTALGALEPELQPQARALEHLPSNTSTELTLVFDGASIAALALDGPYHISLTAYSERVLRAARGEYTTGPYSALQFAEPTPVAKFTGEVAEATPDRSGDGLWDALVLEAGVRASWGGSFAVAGVLRSGGHIIAWSAKTLELSAGPGRVSVGFDGARISSSGLSGPYCATLYILEAGRRPRASEPPGELRDLGLLAQDTLVHTTRPYRASSFERPPDVGKASSVAQGPLVRLEGESYSARSTWISVEVSRSRPELLFHYTADNGSSGRFRLSYTRLLAFADVNGNGVCDRGEERYEGIFALSNWSARVLEGGGGGGDSWAFSAELSADVGMTAAPVREEHAAAVFGWARVAFRFRVAQEPVGFSEPVDFVLRGGAEMKIDILIEPKSALGRGVTGLALEHILSDERGLNRFCTLEGDGARLFKSGGDGANASVFRPAAGPLQKISILGRSGRERGYYTWLSSARVRDAAGQVEWRDANMSYSTDGLQMRLLLNYPYYSGVVSLQHDPTVGVNETNAPAMAVTVERPPFNALVYGLSVVMAAAVVVLIGRRQRRER